MSFRFAALGLLCLAIQTPAATTLPPILISAARTAEPGLDIPAASTVIKRQQIEDSGARDLGELLRRVVGVHVADALGTGGNARIDMRGFGSTAQSNVAVLVNGRKINPATDSATLYLNGIDLDSVEQVEIVEGSAGTLYGNQAVGGLINVITRRPERRTRHARLGAGSYDSWELLAGLTEPLGDRAALGLQLHRRDSDNYRDANASRLERLDAQLEIEHRHGRSYFDLQLLEDYVQTPGALFADELAADRRQAVFTGDFLDTSSRVLRLGTEQRLGENWRFEGELALRDDHRDFVQSFRFFPGSPATQDRESLELTPRLVGRYGDRVITLGMDLLATDYRLVTAFGPQDNDQRIIAWYGQLTQPLSPALAVTAGLRHARVDNDIDSGGAVLSLDDSVSVGSLGLVYRPASAWRLFLRADQNYRFAKVDEHTNPVFGQPVGLENQTGVSYETGVEYRAGAVELAARAFHLALEDEISFDATNFNANVNLPHSRRRGLALSADARLRDGLTLGAGYEYIDAEITSGVHDGSRVPLVPRHKANLRAAWRPTAAWLLAMDLAYIGEQFLGADFDNASPPLDAYSVVDLVVHRDLGDWRVTAKVNNLFDERYSETGARSFAGDGFNPAPERNLWLGVSYRFEE
jgi:iron complex outermembrane receptor protein